MNKIAYFFLKANFKNMKKKLLLFKIILLLLLTPTIILAQFVNKGRVIFVQKNAKMYIKGNVSNDSGYFKNNGLIIAIDAFKNHSVFESGPGSHVKLEGDTQEVGGTKLIPFWNLFISGTNHKFFTGPTQVNDSLFFIVNKIILKDSNLTLTPTGKIVHPSPSKHIVTIGQGFLVKKMVPLNTNYLFPVSDTLNTYKPVIINYTGNIDTFAVKCLHGIHPTTGADSTTVFSTFFIKESNPGGTHASLSLGWNHQDQGIAFNNSWAMMWQNINGVWHPLSANPGGLVNTPQTDWYYKVVGLPGFVLPNERYIIKSMPVPEITQKPVPAVVCEGDNAHFSIDAISMLQIYYQWQVNCGSGWIDVVNDNVYSGAQTNDLTVNHSALTMNVCLFRCIVSNDAGYIMSDAVSLTVNVSPVADFYAMETLIKVMSYAEFYDLSTNASYWEWNFGEGSSSLDQNPIQYYYVDGFYTITLIVTSPEGCKDTIVKENYIDVMGPDIYVPSLFTPNGDGINDVLYVRGESINNFNFKVFNQLGILLFETTNQNMGWKGSVDGKNQPEGNYLWTVEGITRRNKTIKKQGVVTLAR